MQNVKSLKFVNKNVPVPFGRRFIAFLIDFIVVNLVVGLPFYPYLIKFDSFSSIINSNDYVFNILAFVLGLSLVFYFSILEYKTGQTLGKAIFGIYVIPLVNKQLTFSQILLSNLTIPFSIVLLVDVLYMFFKGNNQRLFETFSGVIVVSKGVVLK